MVYLKCRTQYFKRAWDDECVVYKEDSRETHLLTAPSAHIFNLLEQGPVSYETLRNALHIFLIEAEDSEVIALLSEIVNNLEKIALIESLEDVS